MDTLLARLGVQAMNYAIRSGIAVTSTYAISQFSRLLKDVDDKKLYAELESLQKLLDIKIRLVSPAIDLIEFKSGRGDVFLEGGVPTAKSLHQDITALGKRLESVASDGEVSRAHPGDRDRATRHKEALKSIVVDLRNLISRIDHDIPALQLALNGSRESLDTSLPPSVSPSRLLQASTFLIIGDTQYALATSPVQIGPSFTLSLYMLFLGHTSAGNPTHPRNHTTEVPPGDFPTTPRTPPCSSSSGEEQPYGFGDGERKPLWQEVMHKARVRLCRTPIEYVFDPITGYRPANRRGIAPSVAEGTGLFSTDEYAYHLEIIEDLDDNRVHDDTYTRPYESILQAGRRESIPIHHLSKIFYTDTGRILNIGDSIEGGSNPVLLLKRDVAARPPERMANRLAVYDSMTATTERAMVEDGSEPESSSNQSDIDRQLLEESSVPSDPSYEEMGQSEADGWKIPSHLDPEWIALEVFEEDNLGASDPEDSDDTEQRPRVRRERQSLDSKVVDQIRHLSIGTSAGISSGSSWRPFSQDLGVNNPMTSQEALVSRSPFGAITTSLSLMEMLIRLTSLQEFQQTSHLAIPDHILTFFLEETSTTGLTGEDKWNARNEARRRVGFDPYTDTPSSR
ncbi:related to RanGTP-binding protein [Cephalotrichum gorgonifer]|uniref:Related to RanGTP-binding protein n=1 Tax=Cephalotrichum gorgonifer TaxID=2041049 RepID=A0AAE8MRR5_9PEZI|nr:related to RanGTP-binding protein [Cephalotrichum gorgonifer]